jgi:hypothetical protein
MCKQRLDINEEIVYRQMLSGKNKVLLKNMRMFFVQSSTQVGRDGERNKLTGCNVNEPLHRRCVPTEDTLDSNAVLCGGRSACTALDNK